ncbi:MAG TPA: hypothetical protein P5279_06840 [Anaerohalosphaeraceae bacterium]|jgi:hypothetical protein|nr:hypothetical protein [Anaerohalosphaeraceae bacterium]HRT50190.1 hypothetical protein [Anaerohalosphaeraceae bacterium]HRT86121.1 hypothetical protein [Anaerohalosphaeraceae bacterium]
MAMDVLDKAALNRLLEYSEPNCVSFYVPTHKHGEETKQDRIHLKNLMAAAARHLENRGLSPKEAEEMLKPVHQLLREDLFWSHLEDGLAIFLAREMFEYYRLPVAFHPEVYVAKRYLLRPLVPMLSGNGRFFLLTLSQKKVRLFEGDRYSLEELELTEAPTTMEVLEQYRDIEKFIQVHTMPRGTTQGSGAMFHGHGEGVEGKQVKKAIEDLIKSVEKGVNKQLAARREPLVLAGTDYLCSVYREVNSQPRLKDEVISGNPELIDRRQLHSRAWKIVEGDYDYDRNRRATYCWDKIGTELVVTDPRRIVPAAYEGRLDTLFVDPHEHLWGTFRPEDGYVQVEPWYDSNNEDLVDTTVHYALGRGGHVYPSHRQAMPGETPMTAIMRY